MASKTQRFRKLIEAEDILIQPGIHDRFSTSRPPSRALASARPISAGPMSVSWDTGKTCTHRAPLPPVSTFWCPPTPTRAATRSAHEMKNALAVLLQSANEGSVIERPDLAVSFQE
jgi:hypothetical protein